MTVDAPEITPADTLKVLQILDQSGTAFAMGTEASRAEADRLREKARTAHPLAFQFITGGMMIGEIPAPDSDGWVDWFMYQETHLRAAIAHDTGR